MLRSLALLILPFFLAAAPASAQELPEGQGEAEYRSWLASGPSVMASVLSFESWQQAAGVYGVLPTWQIVRTASMWRQCGGPPFEIPPPRHWPGMAHTLRFIRDHVRPVLGPVEAVSGYRNEALNACAQGSATSAHRDYFALDLVPVRPIGRGELFRILCSVHARHGPASGAGLGFYAFQRFHIDTRSFRRWGSAGPMGNESPCAVIERGGDPLAPPLPPPPLIPPVVVPPPAPPPQPVPVPNPAQTPG
ncbi:hypothetical protein [Allosphingosinicella sp.]|jgi:hypothetical protein|uniref:hypothetical protein n=1 Tax=Allosphingosinicella sp. TaxID=2823234 RepID=UPI002EECCFAC